MAVDHMWKHKDDWRMEGDGFLVSVTRHSIQKSSFTDPDDGLNRWAVYAYVYPSHKHFMKFDKSGGMWQEAASVMPLHGGPSFLRAHVDIHDGSITSWQVGADYSHLHDEYFYHFTSMAQAQEVFHDAKRLFDWLSDKSDGAQE